MHPQVLPCNGRSVLAHRPVEGQKLLLVIVPQRIPWQNFVAVDKYLKLWKLNFGAGPSLSKRKSPAAVYACLQKRQRVDHGKADSAPILKVQLHASPERTKGSALWQFLLPRPLQRLAADAVWETLVLHSLKHSNHSSLGHVAVPAGCHLDASARASCRHGLARTLSTAMKLRAAFALHMPLPCVCDHNYTHGRKLTQWKIRVG